MRPVLVSYFDLGVSYGLSDSAFPAGTTVAGEIGMVGLEPALGHGLVATVPAGALDTWREEAATQAHRDVLETGRTGPRGTFDAELENVVRRHPIERCTLTVYAIGTVYVELWFAPVEAKFLRGLLKCFEFAGYKPAVAQALHGVGVRRVAEACGGAQPMDSPLTSLTRRALPAVVRDPSEKEPDDRDYEEQLLIPSFTTVLVCTDEGDLAELETAMRALDPETDPDDRPVIKFEYHGEMWCGSAVSAVVARRVARPGDPGDDTADDQVKRPLACIQIATVFYGTCEAFERLFLGEIDEQVDGYLRRTHGGRQPEELNRLRNLALAVVSLTGFTRVTPTKEDQDYFAWVERESELERKRDFIRESADILYNVADAETQANRSRRELTLNVILLLLTSVTLLSVSADAYDFIRDQDALIGDRGERVRVLLQFLLALILVVAVIIFVLNRPHGPWRRRASHHNWHEFDDPTRPPPAATSPGPE